MSDAAPPPVADTCPGPLVWFDVDGDPPAAVLECATCDYVIATGSFNDATHAGTQILRSPA